jgi:hypothetical protein
MVLCSCLGQLVFINSVHQCDPFIAYVSMTILGVTRSKMNLLRFRSKLAHKYTLVQGCRMWLYFEIAFPSDKKRAKKRHFR